MLPRTSSQEPPGNCQASGFPFFPRRRDGVWPEQGHVRKFKLLFQGDCLLEASWTLATHGASMGLPEDPGKGAGTGPLLSLPVGFPRLFISVALQPCPGIRDSYKSSCVCSLHPNTHTPLRLSLSKDTLEILVIPLATNLPSPNPVTWES